MYITINKIIGEKRIDLTCLIKGKEVAVVSVFSDNVQYQVKKLLKLRLSNGGRFCQKGRLRLVS